MEEKEVKNSLVCEGLCYTATGPGSAKIQALD